MRDAMLWTTIWPAGRAAGFGEKDCAPLMPTALIVRHRSAAASAWARGVGAWGWRWRRRWRRRRRVGVGAGAGAERVGVGAVLMALARRRCRGVSDFRWSCCRCAPRCQAITTIARATNTHTIPPLAAVSRSQPPIHQAEWTRNNRWPMFARQCSGLLDAYCICVRWRPCSTTIIKPHSLRLHCRLAARQKDQPADS